MMGLFEPAWMFDGRAFGSRLKQKKAKALAAVEKIKDPDKLKDAALRAPLEVVADEACSRVEDDQALAEIALGARASGTAAMAAHRISDLALLRRVALEAEPHKGGRVAAQRISDQATLVEIACSAADFYTREEALGRVRDTALIVEQLRAGNWRFFLAADHIDNQDVLREVLFDLFDAEAIAYDSNLSARDKEDLFGAVARIVDKLESEADAERVASVFGDGCSAGIYAEPVARAASLKRASLEAARTSGQVVLVCKTCGGIVLYEEDYDSEDPSWAKTAWFHCSCGRVGGGPRRNGDYEKPSHVAIAVSREPVEGHTVSLCPSCLKRRHSSPNSCMIPACTCQNKLQPPVVAKFVVAGW